MDLYNVTEQPFRRMVGDGCHGVVGTHGSWFEIVARWPVRNSLVVILAFWRGLVECVGEIPPVAFW